MLYTGRRISGEEAARIGLADRLVDPDGIRAAAHGLAAEIAASAPLAVRSIRATMRGGLADRVRAATARERAEQNRLRHTADWQRASARPPSAGPPGSRAEVSPAAAAGADEVRAGVREWLVAANWDPELSLAQWRALLADSGWGCPAWPRDWCGRGLPAAAGRRGGHRVRRGGRAQPAGRGRRGPRRSLSWSTAPTS